MSDHNDQVRTLASNEVISVVAPFFNEAGNVVAFVDEVRTALENLDTSARHELVLVDDGSWDGTGEALDALANQAPDTTRVVHLARNFGHACAVTAGLDHARGQVVILMDSDMQDDPRAFKDFLRAWEEGYDVVYAQRVARKENAVSRSAMWIFYRAFAWIANIKTPLDSGNYCLMDRRVVKQLGAFTERNRYLPGLRAWVGFQQKAVPVARRARYDDRPRVGIRGLWTLGMNAIFSFSYVPLFVFRIAGALSLGISGLIFLFALYRAFSGADVQPWATQLAAIAFLGGINLFGIGVMGEYIARIYDEVKGRPIYIVERTVGLKD